VRDFNLIRSPQNRSLPRGNFNEVLLFNDLFQPLDLMEIFFQGREFTWSNMQASPLLKKLDWVFTSSSWTLSFPDTKVIPLARPISDHIPCGHVWLAAPSRTKLSGCIHRVIGCLHHVLGLTRPMHERL
jgi:endonuclease/exonuclease/phosphatase family metal-dependent hydrolase